MKKKSMFAILTRMILVVTLSAAALSACGAAGGATSTATRDVNGLLVGSLSGITVVQAVGLDGTSYSTPVPRGVSSYNFTLTLPTNSSYQINLLGANGSTAATLHFPASVATQNATGATTTKYFTLTNHSLVYNKPTRATTTTTCAAGQTLDPVTNTCVTAPTTTAPAPAVNIGTVTVPAGTGNAPVAATTCAAGQTLDAVTNTCVASTAATTGTTTTTTTGATTSTTTGTTTTTTTTTTNTLTSSLNPLDQDDEDGNGVPDSHDSNYMLLAPASAAATLTGTTSGTTTGTTAGTTTGTTGTTGTGTATTVTTTINGENVPNGTVAVQDHGDGHYSNEHNGGNTTGGDNGNTTGNTTGGTTGNTTGGDNGNTTGGTTGNTTGGDNGNTTGGDHNGGNTTGGTTSGDHNGGSSTGGDNGGHHKAGR